MSQSSIQFWPDEFVYQPQRFYETPTLKIHGVADWAEDGKRFPEFDTKKEAVGFLKKQGLDGNVLRYRRAADGSKTSETAGICATVKVNRG